MQGCELGFEAHFAAGLLDLLADVAHDVHKQVGADVGFCLPQDLLGRARFHEQMQDMLRPGAFDVRGELSVRERSRPAFAVLVYPVITAEPGKCHKGSFDNLLGTDRTADDEAQWSLQNRVTASTPPTLLLLADDDRTVPPVNSTLFYEALKRNGVKGCSLRIYPSGGHGGGFNPDRIYRTAWRADVLDWLGTLPSSASH